MMRNMVTIVERDSVIAAVYAGNRIGVAVFWSIWIIVGVLSLSLAFMSVTWDKDRFAALCFVPYIAWLGFALLINVSVWIMN